MGGEFENLVDSWIADVDGLGKKWMAQLQDGVARHIDALTRDAFDPKQFMDFLMRSGVNLSDLPGVIHSQRLFDPYRILGLDSSATEEEVKKRYRTLLYKLHPDTAGAEGTAALFQIVMTAYEAIKRERGWS